MRGGGSAGRVSVQLRPESALDEAFLRQLIMQSIALELRADLWPEPMRTQLLTMQYQARRTGHRAGFPEGQSHIITLDGEDAGWIFLAEMEHAIHVVEIMLLPELRGRGVGTQAMRYVLELAAQGGKPVTLTVNVLNEGAIRLYERLGFRRTGGTEVQHAMEWRSMGAE